MPKAFSALILVMIITVASLALALSSVWLGLGQLSLNEAWQGEDQALRTAEACAEIALVNLQTDNNYNGGNLSLGSESCIIIISKTGSPWTSAFLRVVSTAGDWHKALLIGLSLNESNLIINSWQETSL